MFDSALGVGIALRAMAETLRISAPTVLDALVSRATMARCDVRLAAWSRRLLEQADVHLEVSGLEHVEPGRPYVVMSNHASHYDIPVLFQAYPGRIRMIAKTELFRIPVFGRAMTAAGFVEIDRSDRRRAAESLRLARERLMQGTSVWIAPEGTRSRTGELAEFKKGGFVLSRDAQLPILPTAIAGTGEVLSADGLVVHRGARVHVAFRPAIAPVGLETRGRVRDANMAEVRASIERGLADGRARLARAAA